VGQHGGIDPEREIEGDGGVAAFPCRPDGATDVSDEAHDSRRDLTR
jgi:hypothetical protein